ncbi:SpoIIE family protein phosphatase [Cellulomonas sp. JZ18]|uniref:SpoIIE family protein phosphatase n=1 Tax=Cellulomonas sp. JZ18 TaxID=2654191 RepID=UPI0012D44D0D|nr:SpoIIE family protein phosphatase [Cellulomonas sp. JZ18]QGQ20773.1 SpoIIE family protein phosphatase [Cellulomonas sp. JZ18]
MSGGDGQPLPHVLDDVLTGDLARRVLEDETLAIVLTDPSLPDEPVVWTNEAFTRLTGWAPHEARGRNCRFLQTPRTDPAAVARLRAALAAGQDHVELLLNARKDGSEFWNQLVVTHLRDAEGRVTHRVGVQVDVTARAVGDAARDTELVRARQTGERLALLAAVTDELTRHLEYGHAVDALAEVVVPRMATWGFVAVTNERGRFERVHVVTTDPARAREAAELAHEGPEWLVQSSRVQQALTSAPDHVADAFPVDVDSLPGRTTPRQLALLSALGLGSALVVPLRARSRVIGVLCLVHERPDGFDQDAVVTAAHLSSRAGIVLENVRLYLAERDAALTLQHSLLPVLGDVAGLDVAASYLPSGRRAEVGGDWFEAFALPDGAVGLAVGDVVGHDLRAAASMGQLRSLLRAAVWSGDEPGPALARLDDLVRGLELADLATCVQVRWERTDAGAHLTWASAGHPPAVLRLPDGEVVELTGGSTTPVGLAGPGRGTQASATFPPGSTLVLYSDGLVERRDRTLREGVAALRDALAATPSGASAEQVRDALVGALVGRHQEDDVCLLVVRDG